MVHDTVAFMNQVLPRYFNQQTKYKSFQRQLSLYGFTRITNGRRKGMRLHDKFLRGQRRLCRAMKRVSIMVETEGPSFSPPRGSPRSQPTPTQSLLLVLPKVVVSQGDIVLQPACQQEQRTTSSFSNADHKTNEVPPGVTFVREDATHSAVVVLPDGNHIRQPAAGVDVEYSMLGSFEGKSFFLMGIKDIAGDYQGQNIEPLQQPCHQPLPAPSSLPTASSLFLTPCCSSSQQDIVLSNEVLLVNRSATNNNFPRNGIPHIDGGDSSCQGEPLHPLLAPLFLPVVLAPSQHSNTTSTSMMGVNHEQQQQVTNIEPPPATLQPQHAALSSLCSSSVLAGDPLDPPSPTVASRLLRQAWQLGFAAGCSSTSSLLLV